MIASSTHIKMMAQLQFLTNYDASFISTCWLYVCRVMIHSLS